MNDGKRQEHGFSLLEAVITVAIILFVGSIAVLALGNTLRAMHANTGLQTTVQVLRRARQTAIDQRATVLVTFNTPAGALHTMTIQRVLAGAPVLPPVAVIPLPWDVQFSVDPNFPGPPNTPDNIGNATIAVDFVDGFTPAAGTQAYFLPDGSVQNAVGNTINGVVYIERTGYWQGARAVTLFGATGRLRSWQLAPTAGGYKWR